MPFDNPAHDLHPPQSNRTLAMVMAAGYSHRFGDLDKRQATLASGETLLATTLQRLLPEFEQPRHTSLAVVIRPDDRRLDLGIPKNCHVLRAWNAELGLGASIADGIAQIATDPRWNHIHSLAIFLGDMPNIHPTSIQQLIAHASPQHIIRPFYQNQPGHPVIIGREFWGELAASPGEDSARRVIQRNQQHLIRLHLEDPGVIDDIDTQEDWQRHR